MFYNAREEVIAIETFRYRKDDTFVKTWQFLFLHHFIIFRCFSDEQQK